MSLQPGETICNGKYEILALAGEGHFARVWQAREPAFANRLVAIKELKRERLTAEELRESEKGFWAEVEMGQALADAEAPNVARAVTVEQLPEGESLLVMAYMAGGNLATRLKEQPEGMPLPQALDVALQICAALHVFHHLPRLPVHRDIKPSNILFNSQGKAQLSDFGLAQLTGASSGRSRGLGGPQPGTPLYMAPEQATDPGYLSPAADIYALGCVLFEMLTGRKYKRLRPGTLAGDLRADVPQELDNALARALAEDPWERFQDAAEFGAALTEVRSRISGRDERSWKQAVVSRPLPVMASIALLVCAALSLLALAGWQVVQALTADDNGKSATIAVVEVAGSDGAGSEETTPEGDGTTETAGEAGPDCSPQPARVGVVDYTVQVGEDLLCLVQKFDLESETLQKANAGAISVNGDLVAGISLSVPPEDGALYQVTSSDLAAGVTLENLAEWYSVEPSDILNWQGEPVDASLMAGQQLFVRQGDLDADPFRPPEIIEVDTATPTPSPLPPPTLTRAATSIPPTDTPPPTATPLPPTATAPPPPVVRNGTFDSWTGGLPSEWEVATQDKAGFEFPQLAQMTDAGDNAVAVFLRNLGGTGSYYAFLSQDLGSRSSSDTVKVVLDVTSWAANDASSATKAWYVISDGPDPFDGDWISLNLESRTCAYEAPSCPRVATVSLAEIPAGQPYIHIVLGQVNPDFNAQSLFWVSDVRIVSADDPAYPVGDMSMGTINWSP